MSVHRRAASVLIFVLLAMLVSVPGAAAAARSVQRAAFSAALAAAAGVTTSTIDDGSDDRLTVLLMGSDQRPGLTGERIDVIMVASRQADGKVVVASVPRDTMKFPRAVANRTATLLATSGADRVNEMFRKYLPGCAGNTAAKRRCAAEKFRKDVAYALNVQIDYWAYIKFTAFDALVDELDGVTVTTPGKIVDPSYMDEPTLPKGVWFVDGSVELRGLTTPNCRSKFASDPACQRAMPYVRSRKGSEGTRNNSDYRRALRQQTFVISAMKKAAGFDPTRLDDLLAAMNAQTGVKAFDTNMPRTPGDAVALATLLQNASLGAKVVFAPSKFATQVGTKIVLKLTPVRSWIQTRMSPAGP